MKAGFNIPVIKGKKKSAVLSKNLKMSLPSEKSAKKTTHNGAEDKHRKSLYRNLIS